jgi:DnaK suppressor protein
LLNSEDFFVTGKTANRDSIAGAMINWTQEPRMTIKDDKVRARLIARQTELQALADTSAESRKPVELDQTSVGRLSRMDALQGQAMALETEQRRKNELGKIERALIRVDEGEYGYCLNCGEEIAPKRLELDPAIPMCIDCAGPRS